MIARDCNNCQYIVNHWSSTPDPEDPPCLVVSWRAGPCKNYRPNIYMEEIDALRAENTGLREKLRGRQKKLLVKVIP